MENLSAVIIYPSRIYGGRYLSDITKLGCAVVTLIFIRAPILVLCVLSMLILTGALKDRYNGYHHTKGEVGAKREPNSQGHPESCVAFAAGTEGDHDHPPPTPLLNF